MLSYNLIDETWIPCRMKDGSYRELGIKDVLIKAHQIQEIRDNSPLTTAAILRTLLAILHRIFGPADMSEWLKLWNLKTFPEDQVNQYLNEWRHKFDLYDESHPFYQVSGYTTKKASPITKMGLEFASGNNDTLFDHHSEDSPREIPNSEIAKMLITFQSYALGGGKSKEGNLNSALAVDHLTFIINGESLWETLMLNLIWHRPGMNNSNDLPAWERKDVTKYEERHPEGYLDYLTWQSRSIRILVPDDLESKASLMFYGSGYKKPNSGISWCDPLGCYISHPKHGLIGLRCNPDRALWRDSDSFLVPQDSSNNRRPEALACIEELIIRNIIPEHQLKNISAIGLATDQAKVFLWRHDRLPLPFEIISNKTYYTYLTNMIQLTEKTYRSLNKSLYFLAESYLKGLKDTKPNKEDINNLMSNFPSTNYFWASLEVPFTEYLTGLAQTPDESISNWYKLLYSQGRDSLRLAEKCLGESGKSLRASIFAEKVFNSELREIRKQFVNNEEVIT